MKLIFVNRFFYPDHSATSQMLTDIAFALVRKGWQVQVICSRAHYDNHRATLAPRERIKGVDVRRVASAGMGGATIPGRLAEYAVFYLGAFFRVLRDCRHGDIVIAKTDPPLLSAIVAPAVWIRRGKLVNWLQDLFPEIAARLGLVGRQAMAIRLLTRIRNRSLQFARRNVCIGNSMRDFLVQEGIEPTSLSVIPNWADEDNLYRVTEDHNPLVEEWSLAGRDVVLYSGNMGRAHSLQTIVDAAGILRSNPRIVFLFIGGGHQLEQLKAQASEMSLSNCIFRDYLPREQVRMSLSLARVHLTSLRPELEGLIVPSKIYGILAIGGRVVHIGTHAGEIGTLIREHDLGAVVQEGAAEKLAVEVERQIAESTEAYATRVRKLFTADYSLSRAEQRWDQVLLQTAETD